MRFQKLFTFSSGYLETVTDLTCVCRSIFTFDHIQNITFFTNLVDLARTLLSSNHSLANYIGLYTYQKIDINIYILDERRCRCLSYFLVCLWASQNQCFPLISLWKEGCWTYFLVLENLIVYYWTKNFILNIKVKFWSEIFFTIVLSKFSWRQLMSVMSQSGGKN